MSLKKALALFLAAAVAVALCVGCSRKKADNYIQLSQVKMHYQRLGSGSRAVILLHGNGSDLSSLSGLAKLLSKDYTVYSLDSRCHGKSSDTDEITYNLMADDVYEFINKLKIDKPYIIGHSDGGIVALTLAAGYPDSVGAVVACGANSSPARLDDDFYSSIKEVNDREPDKLLELMLNYPDLNKEELAKIKCPCLILAGENDVIKKSDTEFIANSIDNSKMVIIDGEDHSSYILSNGEKAYELATDFFNGIN